METTETVKTEDKKGLFYQKGQMPVEVFNDCTVKDLQSIYRNSYPEDNKDNPEVCKRAKKSDWYDLFVLGRNLDNVAILNRPKRTYAGKSESSEDKKASTQVETEATSTEVETKTSESSELGADIFGKLLQQTIDQYLKTGSFNTRLNKLVQAEVAKNKPKIIEIQVKSETETVKVEGKQHYLFPLILKILTSESDKVNLALTGPAGSGKTRCCLEAAKALQLKTKLQSFNIMSTKSDVLGYMDATGRYIPSAFVIAFEQGHMFIADEFDACHPAVATILNAAIANRQMTLPDNRTISANKNFRFIACMNTVGLGATAQYVGRNALDGATLDRFAMLHFGYCESLEAVFAEVEEDPEDIKLDKGKIPSKAKWLEAVRTARKCCEDNKWLNIISPRATIAGISLASVGIGRDWLFELLLYKGLNPEQRKVMEQALRYI